MEATRRQRRALERDNAKWPSELKRVPSSEWPDAMCNSTSLLDVWRSRDFLVQIHTERHDTLRLTVCRTAHTGKDFVGNITWDDLQRLKRECGFGDREAVEIYPRDKDIINVASMRHLWIVPTEKALAFIWRNHGP